MVPGRQRRSTASVEQSLKAHTSWGLLCWPVAKGIPYGAMPTRQGGGSFNMCHGPLRFAERILIPDISTKCHGQVVLTPDKSRLRALPSPGREAIMGLVASFLPFYGTTQVSMA